MNSANNKLRLRLLCGILCAAAVCGAQDTLAEESVIAKLNAAITSGGVLQGTLVVTASGARSLPYRQAFVQGKGQTGSPTLFGRFMQTRQSQSTPVVTDSNNAKGPISIQFPIREDDFIIPVDRLASLQLDLVPLVLPSAAQPDGSLRIGTPGRYREEIAFEIPGNFALVADSRSSQESAFARYQSDSKAAGGKLIIVRELQLKQETVSGSDKAELESFWKMIREDQQRTFTLRRTSRADLAAWVQSVPSDRNNRYGARAYQQGEYDAAELLLERAIRANPNHPSAWNTLGRALAALGKFEDAQKAYEKQIAINPKDQYAYNNLGLMQEREGYWSMALESFRKQIEIHPGDSYAISNLPRALMQANRWGEGEEAAGKALQAQPNNAQQRLNVAVARACQSKVADERQEIDTALGAAPTANLLNDAAYYLTECDRQNDLAESYTRKALDQIESTGASAKSRSIYAALNSQNSRSNYLDTYGWLLFKQGKIERALNLLNAAAKLAPRAETYAHLAQAESKAGHSEQAAIDWREAIFLEPGQLSQVPPLVAPQLESISPLSLDRVWFPLKTDQPIDVAGDLAAGQPSYFFVSANGEGSVQSVRQLDADNQAAEKVLPAVREIMLPVIQVDASPVPSVFIVKVAKNLDGTVVVGRSVAAEAAAIAANLIPSEFPSPDSAAPQTPAPGTQALDGTYKIGNGVSSPGLLFKVEPKYSEEAIKAKFQGTALLYAEVDEKGLPRNIRIIRPLGLGLDQKAIEAVEKGVFSPGMKDGKPVAVQVQIQVNFRLGNPN
jgi:TonB family protein